MTQKRLLVVDDEPLFADFVQEVAEGVGYEVKTAHNPSTFWSAFEAFQPSVLVVDIVMPDIDGIELVQTLAQSDADVKVILITGFDPLYARSAKALGEIEGLSSIDVYTKPIAVAELQSALA